jgi:hypothetical protein
VHVLTVVPAEFLRVARSPGVVPHVGAAPQYLVVALFVPLPVRTTTDVPGPRLNVPNR